VPDNPVLIAVADLLAALKARIAPEHPALLAFTDAEALRALEVITTRRPSLVMLERTFAGTPRGTALVNRIKADPSLVETVIRIVAEDGGAHDGGAAAPAASRPAAKAPPPQPPAPPALDYRGTRRSPRFQLEGAGEILVDGNRANLVDLSARGAQLLTPTILKPNQRVRVSLSDDAATFRSSATVVWAAFEIPKGTGPRYRAGLEFIDPDAASLDAYITRHKGRTL
jgi:hypothetical protein